MHQKSTTSDFWVFFVSDTLFGSPFGGGPWLELNTLYIYIYIYVYIHIMYVCICIYTHTYICMYVCMYVCMYACMHVCMYTYHIYIYICTHDSNDGGRCLVVCSPACFCLLSIILLIYLLIYWLMIYSLMSVFVIHLLIYIGDGNTAPPMRPARPWVPYIYLSLYIYMYVCVYIYVYTHICKCIQYCIYMYIYIYIHNYILYNCIIL